MADIQTSAKVVSMSDERAKTLVEKPLWEKGCLRVTGRIRATVIAAGVPAFILITCQLCLRFVFNRNRRYQISYPVPGDK